MLNGSSIICICQFDSPGHQGVVTVAPHRLSNARQTVGKRLDALLLLECDRWRSGVISPGRYAF
jgi:hypothetical protein